MDVYCSSESGLMALGNFSHHWPVRGCHIFGFYTSYRLRKSLSTLRTCSKDPNDHQLKKESFAYELSYSLRQAGGNAKRRMLLKVFRFKKRQAFYFCLIASPHLTPFTIAYFYYISDFLSKHQSTNLTIYEFCITHA